MLYLLDTNIVSYLMEGNATVAQHLTSCLANGNIIEIPDIVYYEVQRGLLYNNSKRLQELFNSVCEYYGVLHATNVDLYIAAQQYANLKHFGKLIEDDDILIGSLAIANNAILVTNNTKHLSRLQGIQLENWAD